MRIRHISVSALLTASLIAGGCDVPQNFMQQTTGAAHRLANIGWFVLVVFTVTAIIVWLLILWIAMRRRGSLDWHAPIDAHEDHRWITIGGVTIPLVVLIVVFGLSIQTLRAFPMMHEEHTGAPEIRVIGQQWWFNAEYLRAGNFPAPTELHIPVNRPVDIVLQTRDVIHSFWIPKLHGKVDLVPRQENRIRIQADRPGTYLGECGEYCGPQHAHMRLAVIADTPERYEEWLRQQAAPAASPQTDEERRGADVFQRSACPLCHQIRGTNAHGTVGPDLTHLATRGSIAGGMLDNNRGTLTGWASHAQALKPGSRMPDLPDFQPQELEELVVYLQSLK